MLYHKGNSHRVFVILLLIFSGFTGLFAQQSDTLKSRNLYRPYRPVTPDTVVEPVQNTEQTKAQRDSVELKLKRDRASELAHEQFVKDSIRHHRMALDSLTFLRRELPVLLNACFRTMNESIILHAGNISIIGDTILSDYVYTVLPFNTIEPFRPWQRRVNLGNKSIQIRVDKHLHRITSIDAPFLRSSFTYKEDVLVMHEKSMMQMHQSEPFYVEPFDSIFFDKNKRLATIKKYAQFYAVINKNQRGAPLFLNLLQTMRYVYSTDNRIEQYTITKFCDRWKTYDPRKVCSIIIYTLSQQGNTYTLSRKNNPANNYSDGIFTYAFNENDDLKSISFHNMANTENWQRDIELNKEGNVSCYMYKVKDAIRQSLCMIYHLHEPGAKYPVETITTTFEEDGFSYYQINNTTGQSRTRNRMTLEWGPWQ